MEVLAYVSCVYVHLCWHGGVDILDKSFLMKGHVSELCMLTLQSRKKCDGIFRIPG